MLKLNNIINLFIKFAKEEQIDFDFMPKREPENIDDAWDRAHRFIYLEPPKPFLSKEMEESRNMQIDKYLKYGFEMRDLYINKDFVDVVNDNLYEIYRNNQDNPKECAKKLREYKANQIGQLLLPIE